MTRRIRSVLVIVLCAAAFAGAPGCIDNTDTRSALIDLTSTSAGSLVQILTKAFLDDWAAQQAPDSSLPIADQQH
jgi:hypothetical protein